MARVSNRPVSASTLASVASRAAEALRTAADAWDAYDPTTSAPCETAPYVTLIGDALAAIDVFMAALASRSFLDAPYPEMMNHWTAITLNRVDTGQIRSAAESCDAWSKRYLADATQLGHGVA